jgi:hypothetical protein
MGEYGVSGNILKMSSNSFVGLIDLFTHEYNHMIRGDAGRGLYFPRYTGGGTGAEQFL